MKTTEQKQSRVVIFQEISFEKIDSMDCFQIREKLDELFTGNLPLEKTPADTKHALFRHLETCRNCCRSFDVRLYFSPAKRNRIY